MTIASDLLQRHVQTVPWGREKLLFFGLNVHAMADPQAAAAEVKAEALIEPTGRYRQDYVLFVRAADRKIAFLREYFDPVRAARALAIES